MKKIVSVVFLMICILVVPQLYAQDREAVMRLDAEMTQKRRQAEADYSAGTLTSAQFTERLLQINAEYQSSYDSLMQSVPVMSAVDLKRLEDVYEQQHVIEAQRYEGRISETEYAEQRAALFTELGQFAEKFQGGFYQNADEVENKVGRRWPGNSPGWLKDEIVRERLGLNFRQSAGTRASHSSFQDDRFSIYLTGPDDIIMQAYNEWKTQLESKFGPMVYYNYIGGETHENRYSLGIHSRFLGIPTLIGIQTFKTDAGTVLVFSQEALGSDRGLE